MAGYLNFDPNRRLEFELGRPLEFDPGRALEFQPSRELEFQPNRDLGFGHRGIVFRGYVCPICGALVAPDAASCNECGTVFEGPPAPPPPTPPPTPPRRGTPKPTGSPMRPVTGSPPGAVFCAYCGVRLHAGDMSCWNCGTVVRRDSASVKLPARKTVPVTRDWNAPQER